MKLTIKSLCFIFTFSILIDPDGTNAQMYWNQAASFAGNSSSYAAAPNSFSLNFTGSFTLEAWVNPSNTLNKGVISKGGVKGTSLIYGIRITNSRVVLITNGSPRISSKTTSLIPVNTWTHIATTYDSTSSTFKIYINGLLDTSAVVAAASPHTNTDSVFIGISGTSTPFAGKLDEVRVWNTALSNLTISVLMKSSLGISGDGFFKNLVLSIPFQNNTGTVPYFSSMDFSDKLNNCTARNITAADFKDSPSKNNQISDCAYFSSNSGSAFVAADNPSISPSNKMTIEFWLYPKASIAGLLVKGNGSFYDYGMRILNGKLNAYINNTLITSNDSVKKDRWSHIAFTYFGATGAYEFYINGKLGTTGNISPGNIFDSSDSLYIGILPNVSGMLGFMDELRISNTVKSASEINSQMFTSIN
ncbi:MAG TPA: LamG domain-containing protein, partial [Ignavibacteria bacterium]|nr:LamG domain-containing protein [Ignavibacteria bacterium]HMR41321.1 LamG domain-containing protein [Ignavibacteria bacterium]